MKTDMEENPVMPYELRGVVTPKAEGSLKPTTQEAWGPRKQAPASKFEDTIYV